MTLKYSQQKALNHNIEVCGFSQTRKNKCLVKFFKYTSSMVKTFFQCQSSFTDFIFRKNILKIYIIIAIIFSAITNHNFKILFIRENKIGFHLELPNSNQKQKSN